jgi:hypothetical protein
MTPAWLTPCTVVSGPPSQAAVDYHQVFGAILRGRLGNALVHFTLPRDMSPPGEFLSVLWIAKLPRQIGDNWLYAIYAGLRSQTLQRPHQGGEQGKSPYPFRQLINRKMA